MPDEDECRSETGENDVPAPPFPVNKVTTNRNRQRRDYERCHARWFPWDEKLFIELIIEQVHAGKMDSGRFKQETWNHVRTQFNKVSGNNFSLSAIKGKYYRFKRSWQEFKTLLDFSSKSVWDPKANVVVAPEDIWIHYLQVYPKNKRFQKKGCKYYSLLNKIFGHRAGNGGHFARSSAETQSLSNWDDSLLLASKEINRGA